MNIDLPDFGDLLFFLTVIFSSLIVLFEILERRREGRRQQRILQDIEQEYEAFRRLGLL
ncbi:MAG TPA: hypothetical protein VGL97_19065 [Bryobacteraceae bacterium]